MADLNKENEELKEDVSVDETAAETKEQEQAAEDMDMEAGETEDADVSEDDDETTEDGKKKARLFGKKDKKKDKKDQQIEELNDRVVRQMAEFDNFRKRTEKEKAQMFDTGASHMAEQILPVIDDLERGLAAMSSEEREASFAKGVEMIYKKLMTTLENEGVKPIEALGAEFDPNFHNAVMQAPSEEYDSGYVVNELQKGYMYKEKVLRHSMVIVAE